jgi:Homeodomain-like domain
LATNRKINGLLMRQVAAHLANGKSQKQIATWCRVHRNTIYRIQKILGLTARPEPPSPEQVKRLLDRGNGWRKAAAKLGTSEHVVRYIAEQNGFRRKPTAIPARLVEDILAHKDYALGLSRKYHTDYKRVLALVHDTLGCGRLTPGKTLLPLDSPWPRVKPRKGE